MPKTSCDVCASVGYLCPHCSTSDAAGRAALPDPPEAFLCPDCGHIGDAVSRIDRACVNHPPGERRPMVRLRSRADAERLAAALPDPPTDNPYPMFDATRPTTERKCWDEGWAAREAATCPDCGGGHCPEPCGEPAAALPDERLREALRAIVADFPPTPDRDMDDEEVEQWYADHGDWFQRLVALAATDRDKEEDER